MVGPTQCNETPAGCLLQYAASTGQYRDIKFWRKLCAPVTRNRHTYGADHDASDANGAQLIPFRCLTA